MVILSKKTLCLALCALAAGNAMAEDWCGNEWWGNSAEVSGSGKSEAGAGTYDWYDEAFGSAGTVSVASALATDRVQGSNTISGAGALAEGVNGYSYGNAPRSEAHASTGNYHGGTDSYSDADADAYFNYYGETSSNGDGDFYADGYGEDIVGAMGGEASVAIAEESRGWYGSVEGGAAGLAVSRSKGRQGKDSWYSREQLMELDDFLDHETTDDFILGSAVTVGAGIALANLP